MLSTIEFRVHLCKKIRDWILKSERIRKCILRFFTKQVIPRSLGSWYIQGTKESSLEVDSLLVLTQHDLRDLGLFCLVKKHKIRFSDSFGFKNPILDFLKEMHPQC